MAKKNKNTSIKKADALEKLQEQAKDFINKLHSGDTKGFIDYVKEIEKLKSFQLQQVVCKNLLKRKQSYTKFHFRKQDLRHYVYTTEKLATFLEEKGNKNLAKQLRQEKNDWLTTGLWAWRKKNITKNGKIKTQKRKPTGKQQKKSSKSKPVAILTQQGKKLIRNGKPVTATVTATGEIKISGGL